MNHNNVLPRYEAIMVTTVIICDCVLLMFNLATYTEKSYTFKGY